MDYREPCSLCVAGLEGLSCEAFKGFDISLSGLGNDLLGESWGRWLLRPVQFVQIIPEELLVKTLLWAAGLVGIHGPESRGVGREDFVNEDEASVLDPELKFRIRDDDPFFGPQIRCPFDRF